MSYEFNEILDKLFTFISICGSIVFTLLNTLLIENERDI